MIRRAISRPGLAPGSPVNALSSQEGLNPSHVKSYDRPADAVNRKSRVNPSPTRRPSVAADAALWPAWTRKPLEQIGWFLLSEDGTPVGAGGGY